VYADIVPKIVAVAPRAVLMVVTDPPDPLADLTRRLAGHDRVFSTGTLIDSLRFRVHVADRLRVRPRDVQAMVVGEHGTSEVLLWSSASVSGIPVLDLLGQDGQPVDMLRQQIENDIRYANITIIEGTGALSTSSTDPLNAMDHIPNRQLWEALMALRAGRASTSVLVGDVLGSDATVPAG